MPKNIISEQKVGPTVIENIDFLKSLAKIKSDRKRKKFLKRATTAELLAIIEISINLLKSRFHLSNRQKKRIIPHVEFVRRLSRIRSENSARKLVQKGSGLAFSALLTPILIEAIRFFSQK